MSYILIAIIAYLFFAINAVIDKFLLQKKQIGHPATYAFVIGMLSLAVVVLAPFGFFVPENDIIFISLISGALFTFALLAFFAGLSRGEASRIVPVAGGFVPVFTMILAYFWIGERLAPQDFLALMLLILGSMLMAGRGKRGARTWLPYILLASALFAVSFTLTKQVFDQTGFINGFIWTRFGMAAGALVLLLNATARRAIFVHAKKSSHGTGMLFLAGQIIGALAGIAQNIAISRGSVTIVNALQGTQFVFLLVLAALISLQYPKVMREDLSSGALSQKVAAVILISAGVLILSL